ncbi:MAG: PEP-CTERM sorting domain-containing protein [Cyanobacteria bacterium J06592_8]
MTSAVCFDAEVYAGVLYSTSYEAPDYSVGALSGQEGWLNSFDIDPVVTSGFARTGSQSLEVRQAAGENPFGLTFRAGPYSTSAPMVSVEHSIYLDGRDGWTSPSTFLSPIALIGENSFVSQLAVHDGNRVEFGGEVADIETDRWIDLKLVLDFQTQTSNAFVDGTFIGSEAFDNPATELVQVEIFHIFDNTTFNLPGPSSSFFVDDLSINSVPEPGTILGLLAIGGLGFATKLKKPG